MIDRSATIACTKFKSQTLQAYESLLSDMRHWKIVLCHRKISEFITMIDFCICLSDMGWLPRTHMLVVRNIKHEIIMLPTTLSAHGNVKHIQLRWSLLFKKEERISCNCWIFITLNTSLSKTRLSPKSRILT